MTIAQPWRDLIAEPMSGDHLVQVYRDERVLVEAVALFAGAALGRQEAVVLVATGPHSRAVEECLARDGFEPAALRGWGQLHVLDAHEMLARFMDGGMPDEARFKALMGELIRSARSGRFGEVRVYGEMVDLLWVENTRAALRLEQLWNEVVEDHAISLFCAYCLSDGRSQRVFPPDLAGQHTHLIPLEAA
jgi:hypothetical protein